MLATQLHMEVLGQRDVQIPFGDTDQSCIDLRKVYFSCVMTDGTWKSTFSTIDERL